jgi:hypothetical protein
MALLNRLFHKVAVHPNEMAPMVWVGREGNSGTVTLGVATQAAARPA